MKKLLVLTLVLGMASLASASFSLSVDGTTIGVNADGGEDYAGMWILLQGTGASADISSALLWGDGSIIKYSVDDPTTLDTYKPILADSYGYANVVDIVEFEVIDSVEPFDPIPSGSVLSDVVIGVGSEAATVTLMDLDLVEYDSATIVPEPATLALLGLGGLLLRRRK